MPVPLTQKAIDKAIAAGKKSEIRDGRARGLVLRVHGPNRWEWCIRRTWRKTDYRFLLGNEWSLEEVRGLLVQFDLQCQTVDLPFHTWDKKWPEFLAKRRAEKFGVTVELLPSTPREPPPPQSILFRDASKQWLEEVKRTRRETTADNYRWALNIAEIKPFHPRFVRDITRQELAEAVAAIARRGAERQAELTTIALRRMFKFLGSDAMVTQTNVQPGIMDSLVAPERSLKEDDDGSNSLKVPDADDLARIMAWLDNPMSPAPLRDRLCGKLLVYTAQRRRTIALARKADFQSAGEFGGIWKIPPLHRKSASTRKRRGIDVGAHVVPLPPSVWAVIEQSMELDKDLEFLFPATRSRRAGRAATTIHPSALTHMFANITGNDCSPHDMRRAFGTTYARIARLKLSDVKQILDHSEGVNSGDVTREHYAFLHGEHEKWPKMQGWVSWVDTAAKRGTI